MKKITTTILVTAVTVGTLFFVFYLFGITWFLLPQCDRNYLNEAYSPNGDYKAVYYIENCGATSDYSTDLDLKYEGGWFKSTERVLISKGSHEDFTIQWKDNNHIIVNVSKMGEIFRQMTYWDRIKIDYVYATSTDQ